MTMTTIARRITGGVDTHLDVHVGVGRAYYGWRIAMLVEGHNVEIVGLDGSPLRRLVLDPTKDYQRIP